MNCLLFILKEFFSNFFGEQFTCPILGQLVLLFWISDDVSLGF